MTFKRNLLMMFNLSYRYKQHCYKYCPENTYRDESSWQCRDCPSNCDSCDKDGCDLCKEGFYLSGKQSANNGIIHKNILDYFFLKMLSVQTLKLINLFCGRQWRLFAKSGICHNGRQICYPVA